MIYQIPNLRNCRQLLLMNQSIQFSWKLGNHQCSTMSCGCELSQCTTKSRIPPLTISCNIAPTTLNKSSSITRIAYSKSQQSYAQHSENSPIPKPKTIRSLLVDFPLRRLFSTLARILLLYLPLILLRKYLLVFPACKLHLRH